MKGSYPTRSSSLWSKRDVRHGKFRDSREYEIGLLAEDEKDDYDSSSLPASPTLAARTIRMHKLKHILKLIDLDSIKPAWLRKRQPRRIRPTSYLDGLRGVASLFVFIHHCSMVFFPVVRLGYGSEVADNQNYIIQLPILRVIYSGPAMVDVFLVISGMVLTLKPLRLIRDGEKEKFVQSLSSSVFRRGPRLFIPCLVVTFATATASMSGFILQDDNNKHYPLPQSHSWVQQYTAWFIDALKFVQPDAQSTDFGENLWTIPVEFRGSLMIFLCILGAAPLRSTWMRMISLLLLELSHFQHARWDMFLFLGGMLISEFSLYRRGSPRHGYLMRILHGLLFLFAVYLLSMPERIEGLIDSFFGYGWLYRNFTPNRWDINSEAGRFWPCFGAILLVATQAHAGAQSSCQRFFTTRFIQYLGEISFSLYLWHELVIYGVGVRVMSGMILRFGDQGLGWWLSLLATEAAMIPTLFWVSDLSTIYVDKASVRVGKWLTQL